MKKIVCEVCGSQSIKKINGVFVCQECGMEYSLDEIKKLLVEVEEGSEPAEEVKRKPTPKKDAQNTEVNGKDKLICTLLLWADNLKYLANIYEYFNIQNDMLQDEDFWTSTWKTMVSEDFTADFPKIKSMQDFAFGEGKSLCDRFYGGQDQKEEFESLLKKLESSGKISGFSTYLSYCNELTNGPENLYRPYRPKFYIKTKDGLTTFYLRDCKNLSSIQFFCRCTNCVVYYQEYSKFWGTSKINTDSNVSSLIKKIDAQLAEYEKKCIKKHNDLMDLYQKNYPIIKEEYSKIFANCKELEKELFLPYQYRDIRKVYTLIDMVRSGKATTWKELINLYDTTVFRSNVINRLDEISIIIDELKEVMIDGFRYVGSQLQTMNQQLASIDSSLSRIEIDANKIKNYTFINMISNL